MTGASNGSFALAWRHGQRGNLRVPPGEVERTGILQSADTQARSAFSKTVHRNPPVQRPKGSIAFTLSCTTPDFSTAGSIAVANNQGTSNPITVLAGSQCTVAETLPDAPTGMEWAAPAYSQPGAVVAGQTAVAAITNQLTKKTGGGGAATPAAIPTLGQWALVLLSTLLASLAMLEQMLWMYAANKGGLYARQSFGGFMIKVGVVDDHAIVRSGLKQFLAEHVDLRVVGEAANGREAIDLVRMEEIDVLIMDLSMPGQSGIDALAMLRAKAPDMGILILSGYPEAHYAINLIRQGASGYLNKECDPSEIVEAIRTISLGKRYLTPAVADLLAQQLNRKDDVLPHEQLSEREFQVFLKLARGETAGNIADELSLSVKTVSTYRTRLMEKMGLSSNSDLTYYALKDGLID
ncbi:hypothetical protein FQA39_LY18658 [Lamprigera yunnana]|nr:hypothetical protein FQA39_LY18658 [Lamprigera yunnana]